MKLLSVFKKRKQEKPQKGVKVSDELHTLKSHILHLFAISEKPLFRSYIVKHLNGKKKQDIWDYSNDSVVKETFGLYANKHRKINQMIFFLINQGYIKVIKSNNRYLLSKSNETVNLSNQAFGEGFNTFEYPQNINEFLDKHVHEDISQPKQTSSKVSNKVTKKEDLTLYAKLKEYRNNKAKSLGLPPYTIFHNQTLKNIARAMPTSIEGLQTIHGIGPTKVSKYGEDIVQVVTKYKQSMQPIEKAQPQSFEAYFSGNTYVSYKEMLAIFDQIKSKKVSIKPAYEKYVSSIDELDKYRKNINEAYLRNAMQKEEAYLDNILKNVDPKIKLDQKQREVVLRDEDYTLVVAGAGAGKTTTVAAKVKYLVDKKQVDPSKILIVSYTNDAVNELKTRINHELHIPARISTFHKVGYAIVRNYRNMDKTRVVGDGMMFNIIRDYMHDYLVSKPEDLKRLVMFFGYYLDYQLGKETLEKFKSQHARNDFTTLKTNLAEINQALIDQKQATRKTIKQEVLRSIEEVQIANYLYLHQIDYEYEAAYPYYIEGSNQLYTPDFTITYEGKTYYLEHFGIHENGTHSRYSEEELRNYKKAIQDKIKLHKEKGTKLIYTFSQYNDNIPMLTHLKMELEKVGIIPVQRSFEDVYFDLKKDDNNKYLNKFIMLIKDFIQSYKINGYTEKDFLNLESKTKNVRNLMFLKLAKPIYLFYQQFLKENDMVDFEDMINDSAQILQSKNAKQYIPDFDYVIVDEYQDISQQRFDLTEELSKLTNAKIMAVGDDWQSIFAFAGSRIDLFVNFEEKVGYADQLSIDYTYRNAQEIIDIAGDFIQKNTMQLRKHLKSPKTIKKPIVLFEYSDVVYKNEKKGYKGIIHEQAKICDKIIGNILKVSPKSSTIALLARYNFEIKNFAKSDFFKIVKRNNKEELRSVNYPQAKLVSMTVHSAKGLGFDNVIILNGSDQLFGFPAQIEMDPLLKLVKYDDQSYSYAEERRLFYVALTRTKNRVFILYPSSKPSSFVREIGAEYKLINIHGNLKQDIPLQDRKEKACPLCGYPLQFKQNSAYGLKLFMCTNEPELCDYMTNNLRSGKQSIQKCDQCKDGFLIVKHSKKTDNFFFGCTNYQTNKKGCNNLKELENT